MGFTTRAEAELSVTGEIRLPVSSLAGPSYLSTYRNPHPSRYPDNELIH
jgi:hypothetical protein